MIAQQIINGAPNPTTFDRVGNVYKLPMWIPIGPAAKRAAVGRKNQEPGSKDHTSKAGVATANSGSSDGKARQSTEGPAWEKRDRRGRVKPAGPVAMEPDVVMKESEYRELMDRARVAERPGFTRLGN